MVPFFVLFLLVSFGSVSGVLFTPALPAIQSFFQISSGTAQLGITFFLAGYAIGQLPYGPLANGIGRKKTLYIGIALSILGSCFCALSSFFGSFWIFLLARFIQALGACVGLKMSFTMVLDVCDGAQASRMISRFLVAFAVMPGVATTIGGFLVAWLNWESCFYFLALFGILMLIFISRLPETSSRVDRSALNFSSIIHEYRLKFKDSRLILSGFLVGTGTAVIYIFAARAPFIGMKVLGLPADHFGILNMIPSLGMLLGSFLVTSFMSRYKEIQILKSGIAMCFLIAILILGCFIFLPLSVWVLFIPVAFIYIADAFVYTAGSSLGLTGAKNKANASAVFNFLNIGTALLGLLLSQWIYPDTPIAFPLFLVILFVVMVLLYQKLKPHLRD